MDAVFRIAEKTSGRDKLCRLVQYGSKTVSWTLELEGASADLVDKIRSLEVSIGTARKLAILVHHAIRAALFRLGKGIESLRSALQTIHLTNPVLRLLITLTRISRGLYLLIDHIIWASRMKLVTIDDRFWGRLSNRFWLVSIFLSLMRDIYEFLVAIRLQANRSNQYSLPSSKQVSLAKLLKTVCTTNPALMIDILKNTTDLWIPASRLDLYIPSGIVGLLGVVSSIAGLMGSHDQKWRLKFS